MPREGSRERRIRPPRVQINYDVEIGDAIEKKEIPFVVGVLGNFRGSGLERLPRLRDRNFVEITSDNFDDVLRSLEPQLSFAVENRLSDDRSSNIPIELQFRRFNHFDPAEVVLQIPPLRQLLDARARLADLLGGLQADPSLEEALAELVKNAQAEATSHPSRATPPAEHPATETVPLVQTAAGSDALQEQLAYMVAHSPSISKTPPHARQLLEEFVNQAAHFGPEVSLDSERLLHKRINELDSQISLQLDEIMHHEQFQALEASWRGLKYLIEHTETSDRIRIRLINVSKAELLRDLQRAPEFDQSNIFKKVYEEEYNVFGGMPFALLLGDYDFVNSPEDLTLLEGMSNVAATAHAPFVASAAPGLLNLQSYTELNVPRDISRLFDTSSYAKWKSFRETDDSRYVGLVLPHILLRLPYGEGGTATDIFRYQEQISPRNHNAYLWGNSAYALAARVTSAFALYGWSASIRGVEGGGLVEDLPFHTFRTDECDIVLKCPTELPISDRREKELSDQGFMPLVHCKGTNYAAFFSLQVCHKPTPYLKDTANANARLADQLPYIFAISRFAHYVQAMMRDKIGSFMTRSDCERFLNHWISHYVLLDNFASAEAKAKYPLREARIDVSEVPGKPGVYRAVLFARPHFQLEDLTVPLRVVVDLPQGAR